MIKDKAITEQSNNSDCDNELETMQEEGKWGET